jgi:hypothetical protein
MIRETDEDARVRTSVLATVAIVVLMHPVLADDKPQTPETTEERSVDEAALVESTADVPPLLQSTVADMFSPHYDLAQFPMLAEVDARHSLEWWAHRYFLWILTGEVHAKTEQEAASQAMHAEESAETYANMFGGASVKGLAFPEVPITFFRDTPRGVFGVDAVHFTKGDVLEGRVFAKAWCVAEMSDGSYREVWLQWMYEPAEGRFVWNRSGHNTIRDSLTMLMKLHGVETR